MASVPPPPPTGPYDSPYGAPYGGVPQPHPQGTTILVLGILGVVLCGILAPIAWVMGNSALADINRNPAAYSNRGLVQAGRILGILGTILWIAGIIVAIATS
jgi:Domain of unknown function (DUF4190)